MRETGQVVTNGPVPDPPDPALRGMAIFATESVSRARELANGDPRCWPGGWRCRP